MRNRLCVIAATLLIVQGCTLEDRVDRNGNSTVTAERSPRREIIQPPGVARLPVFSSAVRSGDFIFLSGALGALPNVNPPQVIEGGIEAETRQTMENIITVLDAAGATLEDLIKCTVYLADIEDYAAMNEVYVQFMPAQPPARAALAGSGLALGALVEIDCIAAVPAGG